MENLSITNEFDEISTQELLSCALYLAQRGEKDRCWDYISALRRRGTADIFEYASRWCKSKNPTERELGANILAQLGFASDHPFKEKSLPILEQLISDSSEAVVEATLYALGNLHAHEVSLKAISLKSHQSAETRFALTQALLCNEHPDAISALIHLSKDADDEVRDWATFGLGSMIGTCSTEIQDALMERVVDPVPEVRGEAYVGLARCRDERVIPYLKRELESGEISVLEVEAALRIRSSELLEALEEISKWWETDKEMLADAIYACRTGKFPDGYIDM